MISIKKLFSKLLNLEFYTSRTDLFLAGYDHAHPKQSHAQHKEIEKYQRVYELRDNPLQPATPQKFWDKF